MRETIENLDKAIAILRKIQTNGKVDSSGLSQVIHSLSTLKKQAQGTIEGQLLKNKAEVEALIEKRDALYAAWAGQTPNDETIL